MSLANTSHTYGRAARALHWLTALLILSAIALGLYAESLPRSTQDEVAAAVQIYALHKTVGVAVFFTALARILWALSQPHPAPLHPERRLETLAAAVIHWALYGALVIMPLSGWIGHAAQPGFAPIMWPFGDTLPFVPRSESLAHAAEAVHRMAAFVLYAALATHVLGALKHLLIDRDITLARMTRGAVPAVPSSLAEPSRPHLWAPLAAATVWAVVLFAGVLSPTAAPTGQAPETTAQATPATGAQPLVTASTTGNWQVETGSLTLGLRQMGAAVNGSFAKWNAVIAYDTATQTGKVTVRIDIGSLALGAVTQQALEAEFFDQANHPEAVFDAAIRAAGDALLAEGTLTLRGISVPLSLPFTLDVAGDSATMHGFLTLDRRDFGIGQSYADESSVGFGVSVDVALTARRI